MHFSTFFYIWIHISIILYMFCVNHLTATAMCCFCPRLSVALLLHKPSAAQWRQIEYF